MNNLLMSEHIDQLATALAKAQGEYTVAFKDKKNPFFKSNYADFESVVRATRPALSKYGLSVSHPTMAEGTGLLVTLLMHSSGQWIKSVATYNPPKSDIQSLSGYNTYLKRMSYSNLTGVVTSDEDDDGESAVINSRQRIGSTELAHLQSMPEATQQKILSFNKISKLDELTMEQYDNMISRSKNRNES